MQVLIFWDKFPKTALPTKISEKINILKFKNLKQKQSKKLNKIESTRISNAISMIEKGAPAHQKRPLPAYFVKNSELSYVYGYEVTDSIAAFVKDGFVSGPFNEPPFKKFRVNPISAIPQGGKIRIVLNVSLPKGKSLNDNVNENSLEKIVMSSAGKFSFSIKKCGKNAKFFKMDMKDAYKNVTAKLMI